MTGVLTNKTIKMSDGVYRRLLQYKLDNDCKSLNQVLEQLLKKQR
jgi:predicted CopG family antitoxin